MAKGDEKKAQQAQTQAYQQQQQNIAQQVQPQNYYAQQEPLAEQMGYNYARGAEANLGDYGNIMNRYNQLYDSAGNAIGGGGGGGGGDDGGGGGYTPSPLMPQTAGYTDPFNSYAGYQEFSNTGGYSKEDIGNMRARGVSPVRAAYANAERELQRGRSLQGGYSPNAAAAQVKMAREQGQSGADALQAVEAGLAQARNTGRLAGLGGMSNIEGQRLGADVDLSKFNVGLNWEAQKYNQQAAQAAAAQAAAGRASAAASRAASDAAGRSDQFRALGGMTDLYGTTPAMSATFGNQALQAVGQRGNYDVAMTNAMRPGAQQPQQNFSQQAQNWGNTVGQVAGAVSPIVQGLNTPRATPTVTPTRSYGGVSGTMPAVTGTRTR